MREVSAHLTISSSIGLCREIIVLRYLVARTCLWDILLVSKIENSLCHCLIRCLGNRHSPPEILLGAAVAPLSGWDTVSLYALGSVIRSLSTSCAGCHQTCNCPPLSVVVLIEILASTTLLLGRRTVEVVKHQVHISPLLFLQVINNCFIPMHLYFYVCFTLAGKSAGLMEVIVWLLLTRLLLGDTRSIQCILSSSIRPSHIKVIQVPLLFCLLVITYVEGLAASHCCRCLLLSYTVHKATSHALVVRVVLHRDLLGATWCRACASQQLALVCSFHPTIRVEPLSSLSRTSPSVTMIGGSDCVIIEVVRCDSHFDVATTITSFVSRWIRAFISIAI